jgi:hypothetical protein
MQLGGLAGMTAMTMGIEQKRAEALSAQSNESTQSKKTT